MTRPKILAGIRVLDFTDALSGPHCTRYLADCGAQVINIEKPGGKAVRSIPYFHKGVGSEFLFNNTGKQSLGVDMKAPGARDLILELARHCDVVVENFRPGVMREFGLTYDDFAQVNPAIVMCSISGWGQEGPRSQQMAADLSIQAISGILDLTGDPQGRPSLVGFPVTDILAGLNAFAGICAALYRRAMTGQGDYLDIAMADCAVNCLHTSIGMHTLSGGKDRLQRAGGFNAEMPSWGIFKGSDGYIAISAATNVGWERLTDLMGQPELASDERFATREARLQHHGEVVRLIEEWLATFDHVADVAEILQSLRIQSAPVNTAAQLVDHDEQFQLRGMLKELEHPTLGPVRFLTSPLRYRNARAEVETPPPVTPGEDTREVLREVLQLDAAAIEALEAKGVVYSA